MNNDVITNTASVEAPGIETGHVASWYRYVLLFVFGVTFLSAAGASLLMAFLFAAGLHHIWKAAWFAFVPTETVAPEASGLQWAIHGLEFLYLAPLAFMVLYNLAKYIWCLALRPSLGDRAAKIADARSGLLQVKGLGVSLLIAVIATDLVGKILGHGLGTREAISESIVIIVLVGYFALLEKLSLNRD